MSNSNQANTERQYSITKLLAKLGEESKVNIYLQI
jgi:hypothetical protein